MWGELRDLGFIFPFSSTWLLLLANTRHCFRCTFMGAIQQDLLHLRKEQQWICTARKWSSKSRRVITVSAKEVHLSHLMHFLCLLCLLCLWNSPTLIALGWCHFSSFLNCPRGISHVKLYICTWKWSLFSPKNSESKKAVRFFLWFIIETWPCPILLMLTQTERFTTYRFPCLSFYLQPTLISKNTSAHRAWSTAWGPSKDGFVLSMLHGPYLACANSPVDCGHTQVKPSKEVSAAGTQARLCCFPPGLVSSAGQLYCLVWLFSQAKAWAVSNVKQTN